MAATTERPISAPPHQPLRSYTALATTFNVALLTGIWALRRSDKLIERPRLEDILLIGVATFELSRLITRGKITAFLRRPFARYDGPAEVPAEEEDEAIGRGPRRAVGELITCPYCLGTWIAAGLTLGYAVAPREVRMIGTVFTVKAVSDALNLAYVHGWESQ
jgi:hypothetical protein